MLTSVEFTENFFRTSNDSWIRLDIDFDVDRARNEILEIDDFFVEHRDGENHQGWSSCCLHGIDIDKTLGWENYTDQEQNVKYSWTSLCDRVPYITDFWKNIFPVESYKRLRFMKLDAGGKISRHRDHSPEQIQHYDIFRDGIAVNLAITNPVNCVMKFDSGEVPWQPGSAFMLNVSHYHQVDNYSTKPRVHMIAHAVIGNKKQEFCDLLYRSYKKYHAQ